MLQAFCSSLSGLIASRAVLEGSSGREHDYRMTVTHSCNARSRCRKCFCIRDRCIAIEHSPGCLQPPDQWVSDCHPLYGTRLVNDVTALAILSAYLLGTSLFPEAKTYRLLADIFNDTAFVLDTLSPYFSHVTLVGTISCRGLALCLSGGLRALCGLAAGGSKAAITMHFAQPDDRSASGDIGDLNAKDGSKETVLALAGMLVSPVSTSRVANSAHADVTVRICVDPIRPWGYRHIQ